VFTSVLNALAAAGQQRLCAKDHQTAGGQDPRECPEADTVCHALFSGVPHIYVCLLLIALDHFVHA